MYDGVARHNRWRADNSISRLLLPQNLSEYLTTDGSLTKKLVTLGRGDFQVNVLSEKIELPYSHEQSLLGKPLHHVARIRQVELKIEGVTVVFARSVIPLDLLNNGRSGLEQLGQKPLGALLFSDGKMRISKRQFIEIKHSDSAIYARRTPYQYLNSTILVSEFFLPAMNDFLQK